MPISLVIATRNRPRSLEKTLANVLACDPAPDEIIVVDGDPDASAEPVVARLARSTDIPVDFRTGVSGLTAQRNVGLDAARSEIIVFCDDDVRLPFNAFGGTERAFDIPGVVAATAKIIDAAATRTGSVASPLRRAVPPHPLQGTVGHSGFPRRIVDFDTPRDLEFVHGCFMAARRDVAREVRFDERLSGYALAEDEDFGYRMSRRGRVRYLPEVTVIHESAGFRSIDHRAFNRALVINRAYLLRKNLAPGPGAYAGFALMSVTLAGHRLINGEWAGVRGIAAGWRELLGGRRLPA